MMNFFAFVGNFLSYFDCTIFIFNFSFSHLFRGSEQTVATIDDGGTVWSRQQNAVSVRHAFKTYGPKSKPNQVLNNLNMTVQKGTM
jgi:hypothetical protein